MKNYLNALYILGVITFCLKYYILEKITLGFAGGVILLTVILAAIDSAFSNIIKIVITLLGFGLFLADFFYDMNTFMEILQPLFTMLIALFGIYFLVKRVFGSKNKVRFELDKKTGKIKKLD